MTEIMPVRRDAPAENASLGLGALAAPVVAAAENLVHSGNCVTLLTRVVTAQRNANVRDYIGAWPPHAELEVYIAIALTVSSRRKLAFGCDRHVFCSSG